MVFHADTRLPHRIPPSAYCSEKVLEVELEWMRQNTWQFVGTKSELAKHGDFVTRDVLGYPTVIRNFDSELIALSNVCAHRHSLIRSEPLGNLPELSCQYHGWCYGSDGLTRKIPCAKDFAPIERDTFRLPKYRCESIGQLVFVALTPSVESLKSYLGPMAAILEERCSDDYLVSLKKNYQYQANWKVAVENTLEAYHIQCVHPKTFRTEPGEMRCEHSFDDRHSSFRTDVPFAAENRVDLFFQKNQSRLIRWLGREPKSEYEHHHLYPNLLISFTDAITLVQSVVPETEKSSTSIIYQFGYVPQKLGLGKRWIAKSWSRFEAEILRRILAEDFGMLPQIQKGLAASPHVGALGRSEERNASFQNYWCDVMMSNKLGVDSN